MNEPMSIEQQTDNARADYVLRTALDVGENLLKSGATVHRAEDTIERICRALGAIHVEVFSITTLVLATIRMDDGSYSSQMRRILASNMDFYKIELFNAISRDLCEGKITLDEAQERIATSKKSRVYSPWMNHLASGVTVGAFTVFFGGGLWEMVISSVIALLISIVSDLLPKSLNPFSSVFILSLLSGFLSLAVPLLGIPVNYDEIMVGTVMLFIPGLMFGTFIRDLLCGDTLTGIMEFIQSVVKAAVIAAGYAIPLYLFRGLLL